MAMQFCYMYRCGGNWKDFGTINVVNCQLSAEEATHKIQDLCSGADPYHFIAAQVGIPNKFGWEIGTSPGGYNPDLDHCFHEFEGIQDGHDPSGANVEWSRLLEVFETANAVGWVAYDAGYEVCPATIGPIVRSSK